MLWETHEDSALGRGVSADILGAHDDFLNLFNSIAEKQLKEIWRG